MKRYPLVADRIRNRHNAYNNQRNYIFQQEKQGNALIICPDEPLDCPTLERDTDKLRHIYDLGYQQGLKNIDRVREYIGQVKPPEEPSDNRE